MDGAPGLRSDAPSYATVGKRRTERSGRCEGFRRRSQGRRRPGLTELLAGLGRKFRVPNRFLEEAGGAG